MNRPLLPLLAVVVLAMSLSVTSGAPIPSGDGAPVEVRHPDRGGAMLSAPTRAETLWLFDADFSDLTGDNAGWLSFDLRGDLPSENYWHKDTLFTDSFPYLGDTAWWCGTYDSSFEQGQGYGNSWTCMLERDLELSSWTTSLNSVRLEFDQRYAMEHSYDYGYVDVSDDGGAIWTTIATFSNPGFTGTPGRPQNWPSADGHQSLSLNDYAGTDIRLRFRFESDSAYSCEDEPVDPPLFPLRNGAWQLDNFEIKTRLLYTEPWITRWFDDCESPGDNGWEHEAFPGTHQETAFTRYQYGIDLFTNRDPYCGEPPAGTWMMAAVDPATSRMVLDENSWLLSPRIGISGATNIVGKWSAWVDFPHLTGDRFNLYIGSAVGDVDVQSVAYMVDEDGQWGWYGGPFWITLTDNWDAYVGNDWLSVGWRSWDHEGFTHERQGGLFLDRQRVGTIVGGRPPTVTAERLYRDYYHMEGGQQNSDFALARTSNFECEFMQIQVMAFEGVGGFCSLMTQDPVDEELWRMDALIDLFDEGVEIRYYFEGFDSEFQSIRCPAGAPDEYFEFTLLPRDGEILLVDRHGGYAPGYDGQYQFKTLYYYETALDILGYTWDRFDWHDPAQGHSLDGPSSEVLNCYETVIWFTGDASSNAVTVNDQMAIVSYLQSEYSGRNLVLCGNDLAKEIYYDDDPSDLLSTYMAASYEGGDVGEIPLSVCDVAGGSEFLTSPGGCSELAAGCPQMAEFDMLVPTDPDAEQALSYEGIGSYGAAVAHTDATDDYSVVSYGFGIEYMEAAAPASRDGNGLSVFVDLLGNSLEYLEVLPDTTATGLPEAPLRNELSPAYPNPLNPATVIAYSVKEGGPLAIRVFDTAGRVVRTLLDEELESGVAGTVVWDGRDDRGEECASGVYFYRIDARDFTSTKKMVLLK